MSASPPGKAGTDGELVRSLRATPAERRELLAIVQHELAAKLGLDRNRELRHGVLRPGNGLPTAMDFKTRLEKALELPWRLHVGL
jgi:hypothetical protein